MTNKEPKPSDVNNDLIIYRLDEIKGELVEIKRAYVTKEESHQLKQEIHDLRKDFADYKATSSEQMEALKSKKILKETILWVGLTASAIINIIAMYNVFTTKK